MNISCYFFKSKVCIIFIIILCLLFSSCNDGYHNILHSIDADEIKTYNITDKSSSERGWLNDGTTLYVFSNLQSSEINQVVDKNATWCLYSSDAPINLLLYGGQHEDIYYNSIIDFESTLLEGYYYFSDMQNIKSNYDITDIVSLYKRGSINCVLAVIDISTNTLYYFQYNS